MQQSNEPGVIISSDTATIFQLSEKNISQAFLIIQLNSLHHHCSSTKNFFEFSGNISLTSISIIMILVVPQCSQNSYLSVKFLT